MSVRGHVLGGWAGVADQSFATLLDEALGRLTPGQARTLCEMRTALAEERLEDSEIIASGLSAYLGSRRISARTVHALHAACCIKTEDDMNGTSARYFRITGTGLEMLARWEAANRGSATS